MSHLNQEDFQALGNKIRELEEIALKYNLDFTQEIKALKEKEEEAKNNLYLNISPYQRVKLARMSERPNSMDYIKSIVDDFVELHGDRLFGDDQSIVGGIGRIGTHVVSVIGQRKGRDTKENIRYNFGMPHPEGYRKALRLMKQAEKFNRPIVTFIDTPGAYCGIGAEERGQGLAIARNLMEMSSFRVPIISVLVSEGGSGGALALGVNDKLIMLENAVFSVITAEGCASILFKDASRASEAADALKLTAKDLKDMGIVDAILNEPMGGAHMNPSQVINQVKKSVIDYLDSLTQIPIDELLISRLLKYRNIGKILNKETAL
jgi:acetyl-CoA carboxylase carboxyl transferase subunit alpha